jgi:hypothetical protein
MHRASDTPLQPLDLAFVLPQAGALLEPRDLLRARIASRQMALRPLARAEAHQVRGVFDDLFIGQVSRRLSVIGGPAVERVLTSVRVVAIPLESIRDPIEALLIHH